MGKGIYTRTTQTPRRGENEKSINFNQSVSLSDDKKMCSQCELIKTLDLFYKDKPHRFGVSTICKECKKIRLAPMRARMNARTKERRSKDREKHNKQGRFYLYKMQGIEITEDQFDSLHLSQGGRCAICGEHESNLNKKMALDHDHSTNKVRGFLCNMCNLGLGKFKDDVTLLQNAIDYLKK